MIRLWNAYGWASLVLGVLLAILIVASADDARRERMRRLWHEYAGLILMLVVVVAIFLFALMADSLMCSAKTSDIGMPSRWTAFGGCQVQVESGAWIPLDNWRLWGGD